MYTVNKIIFFRNEQKNGTNVKDKKGKKKVSTHSFFYKLGKFKQLIKLLPVISTRTTRELSLETERAWDLWSRHQRGDIGVVGIYSFEIIVIIII